MKREGEQLLNPVLPPGTRPEGGNLGAGCPPASERGRGCSRVNGGKRFSVPTGEGLRSGRNMEGLRLKDVQGLSFGVLTEQVWLGLGAGPGESRVPGP